MIRTLRHSSPLIQDTYNRIPGRNALKIKNVIHAYCKKLQHELIYYQRYWYIKHIGYIKLYKIKRNFDKKRVDFYATKQLRKKTGGDEVVYYTNDYYVLLTWVKKFFKLRNIDKFAFNVTKGFIKELRKVRNDSNWKARLDWKPKTRNTIKKEYEEKTKL